MCWCPATTTANQSTKRIDIKIKRKGNRTAHRPTDVNAVRLIKPFQLLRISYRALLRSRLSNGRSTKRKISTGSQQTERGVRWVGLRWMPKDDKCRAETHCVQDIRWVCRGQVWIGRSLVQLQCLNLSRGAARALQGDLTPLAGREFRNILTDTWRVSFNICW